VVGAINQFVTKFGSTLCLLVFFAPRPDHTAGPITTHDGPNGVLSGKEVPFGVSMMKRLLRAKTLKT